MKILNRIAYFLDLQSTQRLKIIVLATVSGFTLLVGLVVFYRHYRLGHLIKEWQSLNIKRTQAQELLSKELEIQAQQATVNAILNSEQNFKILQTFEVLAKQLKLSDKLAENPRVQDSEPEILKNRGYSEISLEAKFKNLNMLQVTQLLEGIEKNKRIYTKNLEIERIKGHNMVQVLLVIATLKTAESKQF